MSSRALSPFCYQEDMSTVTTFQEPIINSSEREVVSVSTGLVASVLWPALRSQCSLAGNYQELRYFGALTEIARHVLSGCTVVQTVRSCSRGRSGWLLVRPLHMSKSTQSNTLHIPIYAAACGMPQC